MIRLILNQKINKLGEVELTLTESVTRLQKLQIRENLRINDIIKELSTIIQEISDLRSSLFETLLDEPKHNSSEESGSESSDNDP